MNANLLITNGSKGNDVKLMIVCFRHRMRYKSPTNDSDDNVLSPKPYFHENFQGRPFVRKKLAEKSPTRKKHFPAIKPSHKTNTARPNCIEENTTSQSQCMWMLCMTGTS